MKRILDVQFLKLILESIFKIIARIYEKNKR